MSREATTTEATKKNNLQIYHSTEKVCLLSIHLPSRICHTIGLVFWMVAGSEPVPDCVGMPGIGRSRWGDLVSVRQRPS